MRRMERYLRKNYCQRKQRNRIFDGLGRFLKKESSINSVQDEDEETISLNPWFYEDEELENEYEAKQISPFTLAAIVFTYLVG
ncbi:unnamed protein product [Meloidogyne enterolobii]|uniref:Uncharacterized protein n=1 Tax=Meloidogyne enterolobii TaxID=390850 RepID=A0ACB1AHP1_MELEN